LAARLRNISSREKQSRVGDFFATSNDEVPQPKKSIPDLEAVGCTPRMSFSEAPSKAVSCKDDFAPVDTWNTQEKPNIQDSFYHWLMYMKNVWRQERRTKTLKRGQKRAVLENLETRCDKDCLPPSRQRQRKDIRQFILPDLSATSEEFQRQTELHILSVQVTETPGEFICWVLPRFPQDARKMKPFEKVCVLQFVLYSCLILGEAFLFLHVFQKNFVCKLQATIEGSCGTTIIKYETSKISKTQLSVSNTSGRSPVATRTSLPWNRCGWNLRE